MVKTRIEKSHPAGAPWLRGAVLALTFALLTVYFLRPEYGIDIFWHVATGKHIVETGSFPETDIFNYQHEDRPWVTFEWLYEVAAHGLYELGGFRALRIANVVLLLLGFWLAWRLALRMLDGRFGAAFFVLAVLSVLFHDRIRIRPHVFNLLFLMMCAPAILGYFRGAGWRTFAWVVAIGVLWGNVHAGGVNVMVLMLGTLVLGGLLERWMLGATDVPLKPLVLWGLVLGGALALTPNFLQGNITAITMFQATQQITPEWHATWSYLGFGPVPHFLLCGVFPYLLAIPVVGQGAWLVLRKRRPGVLPGLLMSLVLLYLAHSSARFLYLAVLPLLVLMSWNLPVLDRIENRGRWIFAVAAAAFLATSVHYYFYVQRSGVVEAVEMLVHDLEPARFPEAAADFLVEADVDGRIFNQTEWGGYLSGRLFPGSRVFTDGRGNLDEDELNLVIESHRQPWTRERTLALANERHGLDLTIFKSPTFPAGWWDASRWLRIYNDPDADVFVRISPETNDIVQRAINYYTARGVELDERTSTGIRAFEREIARLGFQRWRAHPHHDKQLSELRQKASSDDVRLRRIGHMGLARLYARADLADEASREANAVLNGVPFHARALLWGAYARQLQGRFGEVEGPLHMALMLDEMSLYQLLGKTWRLNGFERRLAKNLLKWHTARRKTQVQ